MEDESAATPPTDLPAERVHAGASDATLWLFLGSMAAALTMLALIIWWVVKKGKDRIANPTA